MIICRKAETGKKFKTTRYGIKVAGNRVLAPSKLDYYRHEVHPFVRLNSYGATHS